MTSYIQRYQQGECEQVWTELLALGDRVRETPLFSEALSVAYATMERVRYNLDLLIPRLHDLGYAFGFVPHPEEDVGEILYPPVFTPPDSLMPDRIRRLEGVVEALPLSVRAFYEVVGGVNLVGRHPHWEPYDRDALLVLPLDEDLLAECCAEYDEEHGCWYLAIAPDHHFKDGVGGTEPMRSRCPMRLWMHPCYWSGMRRPSSTMCGLRCNGEVFQASHASWNCSRRRKTSPI